MELGGARYRGYTLSASALGRLDPLGVGARRTDVEVQVAQSGVRLWDTRAQKLLRRGGGRARAA